jgi:DinB superfamily
LLGDGFRVAQGKNHIMNDESLRQHLVNLLAAKDAHIDFAHVVADFPATLRGVRPERSPYSGWELLEHIRIAQWDILEFCLDAKHKSPDWPGGYWPASPAPPDAAAWEKTVQAVESDAARMKKLILDPKTNLFTRIPHGEGQTVLREALLLADHNAYHLGQLVLVRRLLGAWKDN